MTNRFLVLLFFVVMNSYSADGVFMSPKSAREVTAASVLFGRVGNGSAYGAYSGARQQKAYKSQLITLAAISERMRVCMGSGLIGERNIYRILGSYLNQPLCRPVPVWV